jgi:carbon-monoxide dehydrogenase large subunit
MIEGLVDRLAHRLSADPLEIRRRNLISPSEFPYSSAGGLTYDECDLARLLECAADGAAYEDHRKRRRPGEGVGIACCVLMGGFGPSELSLSAGMSYGGYDSASVRMDSDGKVLLFTGLPTQGQGLDTALAQICARALGIDAERDVKVVAGDTAVTPYSPVGPIASRGVAVGGSAVHRASERVAAILQLAAAEMLEAAPEDIEISGGRAAVRGVPDRSLSIASVARAVKQGRYQEKGVEPGLEAAATFEPPDLTYSFAVHMAKVRVDPGTRAVELIGYWAACDCGVLVNPKVVEGQIIGGIVQGLGGALTEALSYSSEGQLLTTTFVDYGLLSAAELPPIDVTLFETPTPLTPTGARGAGELGIIGPAAAVANAVADALGGAAFFSETPITPERVWQMARSRPSRSAQARTAALRPPADPPDGTRCR